jgi:sec-independent protein translocase protein TatA
MFGLGTKELIIIAAALLVLFGATRIPALAKGIAESIKHVKDAFKDENDPSKKV